MATASKRTRLACYTEQEPFLGTDKKYYGFISGVGAGKTTAGIIRAIANVRHWNPGEMGAIVAPSTTMVRDNIISLLQDYGIVGENPGQWEYSTAYASEPGIKAPDGTRILILSANDRRTVERLAGLNLAWFWLDEAPRVAERALEILIQRLRRGRYPNGFLTGTPMGYDYTRDFFRGDEIDWHTHEYGEALIYEAADRLAVTRVPTSANPHTGEDYHAQMEQDFSGQVYEQEILGRWVKFEGLVYPWFDESNIVHAADGLGNVRRVFYGVDWGHTNPFGIVAWAETTTDSFVALGEVYGTGYDYDDMVDAATGLQDAHQPGRFFCGPDEPAAIQMFQRAGLDATAAENAVLPGIQYVSSLRNRLYVLDHCQHLINEFHGYHYDEDSDSEDPVKVNDHLMDASRYALFTHYQKGGFNIGVGF